MGKKDKKDTNRFWCLDEDQLAKYRSNEEREKQKTIRRMEKLTIQVQYCGG